MWTLGIDASTQSCSAVVIDTVAGVVVTEASVNFGQSLPHYEAPSGFIPDGVGGEVHSDPRMWLDALELLFEALRTQCDLSRIAAICGAGQQHGSVYLNAAWPGVLAGLSPEDSLASQIGPCLSRETAPIWMDTSTAAECAEINAAVGGPDTVCAKSGSIAIERFTGPQIRRFYKKNPTAYERTQSIHLVSSFLCSVLCGRSAPVDTGDGAGMNLLNINDWSWDPELLEATAPDLARNLPSVAYGASTVGALADYFVRKYGFSADTAITVFTGDNPSSLVGMGASRPGRPVISLGTSDTFFAAMPGAVADPGGCGHVFGNPLGGCMSLQCFVNGSLAREAVKDRFGYDWDQFSEALKATPPGNGGNVMLPLFQPEISPRIDATGPRLRGDAAFERWEQPAAAIRACVEGQFINMQQCTDWMQLRPEVIYLTGGASKNDAIAQIVADVFQVKVQRLTVSGSVALGAAMRAAHSHGDIALETLEAAFCQPEPMSLLEPQVSPAVYQVSTERVIEMQKKTCL